MLVKDETNYVILIYLLFEIKPFNSKYNSKAVESLWNILRNKIKPVHATIICSKYTAALGFEIYR